jgi:hypothetical protein
VRWLISTIRLHDRAGLTQGEPAETAANTMVTTMGQFSGRRVGEERLVTDQGLAKVVLLSGSIALGPIDSKLFDGDLFGRGFESARGA